MGAFMPFILLMMIVMVHELGHFLCAVFLKVPVNKICIYPFGGVSKTQAKINIPLKHEFLILIMGPLIQIIFMFLIKNYLPLQYQNMFLVYNFNILIFNLLPIYPLDGGKLINIIFSYFFSYKNSFLYSLILSLLFVLFLFFIFLLHMKLNIFLLLCLLVFKIYTEYQKRCFYQEKFLLERYLNNDNFQKRCKVKNVEEFRRDYYHTVKGSRRYYTEKEALEKKFKNKKI